jgi:hypothetical protein
MGTDRKDLESKSSALRDSMRQADMKIPLDVYFSEQDRVIEYASILDYAIGEFSQIVGTEDRLTSMAIAQEAIEHIRSRIILMNTKDS